MIDIAIVGNGPAGLSAAITARMRNASCVVIAPKDQTGWLYQTQEIGNYPGLPKTSGKTLLDAFTSQAVEMGASLLFGLVRQIMYASGHYVLLVDNEIIEAKTVILAMGAKRPTLLDGEEALVGNGVSYCATCDGMLYKNKHIAILSAGVAGVHETAFLATLTSSIDYYVLKKHDYSQLPPSVHIKNNLPRFLKKIDNSIYVNEDAYDGVFIIRPAVALSQLLKNLKTESAFIRVDRRMQTNLPGVYAAGDCTGTPLQIAKAVGEGNVAAISACEFLLAE